MGDTDVDPDTAEFHMDAQAEMLLDFMETHGHAQFSLVCHDQGGAAAQIIAARRPENLRCFVLTNCVCYDNWPVPAVARLQALLRIPLLPHPLGRLGFFQWFETRTPLSSFKRGVHRPERLSDEAIHEYLRPLVTGPRERKRFFKFFLAGNPRYTLQAVDGLKKFTKPTLVIWPADDAYISPSWGRKLYEDIPGANRFELVPFCGHFWQEERPSEFASAIGEFLALHAVESESKGADQPAERPQQERSKKAPKTTWSGRTADGI
jgi:pimeloyl-ACP methyl ester carboxylesterase